MENSLENQKLDQQHVKNARLLKETMNTEGWKTIVEPLLSKMIEDVIGYKKKNGEWVNGSFGDKRLGDAKATNLLWYRMSLINFNNHLFSYFNVSEMAMKRLESKDKKEETKHPMKNSKYDAPEGEMPFNKSYGGGTVG